MSKEQMDINHREMVYTTKRIDKVILHNGIYKNYPFQIVSYGTHPCAYVFITYENDYFYGRHYDDINCIDCHGGLTFSEPYEENEDTWLIGWDYAHAGDYVGYQPTLGSNFIDSMVYDDWGSNNGKKYTVEEILKDVYDVIDQIVSKNDGDK